MTIREAADLLGLSPNTIQNQVASGRLRATKHGRDHWITSAAVERYRKLHLGKIGRAVGAKDKAPRKRSAMRGQPAEPSVL